MSSRSRPRSPRRTSKAKPDAAEGHYWLAQATIEAINRGQKPQSAIDGVVPELERAIQLDTDYPDALIALANVSRLRKRDDEAEKALRALIENHPEHPEANYTLGLVLLEKSPGEALACFERGEIASPTDADYPRSRARALVALDRPEEARVAISRAKQLAPNDPRIDQVASRDHDRHPEVDDARHPPLDRPRPPRGARRGRVGQSHLVDEEHDDGHAAAAARRAGSGEAPRRQEEVARCSSPAAKLGPR